MKLCSIIVLLFIGCSSQKKIVADKVTKSGASEIVFEQLVQSSVGGYEHPQIKVFKEQKALEETFGYINSFRKPGFPIPSKIDFSKETVVAVFMGQKNTGGYAVSVQEVIELDGKVKVFIEEKSPGKKDMVTMAITQPFCVVKINTSKEIIFEKRVVK
ncbi:protease complex subunit PrcB family protein [Pseudofulvibacter geojedonensis]|uniref:Protease complex subunit PrcB family protein n=1 Tax=Pseudofulvibacter geojedonensis TaxID=1123758 RepID=A0ABW3I446_9FLAO